MKSKKMLVFNLRGTLLLSYDQAIGLWCTAIKAVGLTPDFSIIFMNWDKPFRDYIIPLLAKKWSWTEEQRLLIIKKSEELFHDLNFNSLANLPQKIRELKESGYELGMITNRSLEFFEDFMADIELDANIFSFIKTGDDGIKKPNPHVFDKDLEKFEAKDIVFIGGDPDIDLVAAQSGGIDFIAVESSPFPKGLFMSRGVPEQMIVKTIADFVNDMLALKKYS